MAAAVHFNSIAAWTELLMLPQAVLAAPPRTGRKHRKATAAFTLDRLRRWQEGERSTLWDTRTRLSRPPRGALTEEARAGLAESLAREGFDCKACSALLASGLCAETPEAADELRALHPTAAAPAALPHLPPAGEVAADTVSRCLKAFPKHSAPGPSGLRVQHLLDACLPGSSAGLLEQLTALVNLLARGAACAAVAPFLAGARLVAVPKLKGGLRPIAVGELLRRLTGKCVLEAVREAARDFFWPAQVGVAVPAGAEKAVHATRAWVDHHSWATDKVLVKLDFANAFNCIDRGAVLQRARDTFYLDDGVLGGSIAVVGAAVTHTQRRASELGLQLNLSKCEAVVVGGTDPAALPAHLPRELLCTADGQSRVGHNSELLGAPVGDRAFMHDHTLQRARHAEPLLTAIAGLSDPQVGLRLLRACAGYARVVHSMRCTPSFAHADALVQFDQLVQDSLATLTGLPLTQARHEQASLGLAWAGLGVQSAARHAPAAYLGSLAACQDACAELVPSLHPATFSHHGGNSLAALNAQLPTPIGPLEVLASTQCWLSKRLDESVWRRLLASAPAADRAELHSEAQLGARAFLAAVPQGACRMEPAVFLVELRRRLRIPDAAADVWCPRCDGVLDTHSRHASMCPAGGDRTRCHHTARNIVASWADRAGLQPEVEKPDVLLPQRPDEVRLAARRPADVYLPAWDGSPTALDLAITGPTRSETLALASQEPLAAASAYAALKASHLNTARTCTGQGVRFQPLVAESTGAWEPIAAKFLCRVARAAALREGAAAPLLQDQLLQELCVAIRSSHCRSVLSRRALPAPTTTIAHFSAADVLAQPATDDR